MSSAVKQAVSELSIPVTWGQIRGKVWGPDHGRPVLCLHGMADNCGTFNTLIPLLPKECRYVAVDMAGHGLSSHCPPGAFYTVPSHVADVRRIVDSLQWTKFSIIGHSMGGNMAAMKGASQEMRQAMDEMLLFEKKTEEKQKLYTFEKAAERLLAANPTLSVQSVHILLERGLAQVEGDSLEQALEMQSNIQARVLVILGDKGYGAASTQPDRWKLISMLLQGFRDRNHMVMTVSGDHYIHLNSPEVIAPFVFDFLQPKVLPEQQA